MTDMTQNDSVNEFPSFICDPDILPPLSKSDDDDLGYRKLSKIRPDATSEALSEFLNCENSPKNKSRGPTEPGPETRRRPEGSHPPPERGGEEIVNMLHIFRSQSTTRDIAASLGVECSDSLGWSSALETPLEDVSKERRSEMSTIERVTLHPKNDMRQSVLCRALFSPQNRYERRSSKSSSSDNMSPLARNIEISITSQGILSQKNADHSFTAKSTQAFKVQSDMDDSFTDIGPYTQDASVSSEDVNNEALLPNVKHSSHIALTSTPVMACKSGNSFKNLIRKSLGETFDAFSKDCATECEASISAINDVTEIESENDLKTHHQENVDKAKSQHKSALYFTDQSAKLIGQCVDEKKCKPETLSSSCDNETAFSTLSLKRKRSSKFIYPNAEESIDYGPQMKLERLVSPIKFNNNRTEIIENVSCHADLLSVSAFNKKNIYKKEMNNTEIPHSDANLQSDNVASPTFINVKTSHGKITNESQSIPLQIDIQDELCDKKRACDEPEIDVREKTMNQASCKENLFSGNDSYSEKMLAEMDLECYVPAPQNAAFTKQGEHLFPATETVMKQDSNCVGFRSGANKKMISTEECLIKPQEMLEKSNVSKMSTVYQVTFNEPTDISHDLLSLELGSREPLLKNILHDVGISNCSHSPSILKAPVAATQDTSVETTSKFFGFRSGRGARIDIDPKCLEAAKNLLMSAEETNSCNSNDNLCDTSPEISKGLSGQIKYESRTKNEDESQYMSLSFKTASNKCVEINRKSILKARSLWNDTVTEVNSAMNSNKPNCVVSLDEQKHLSTSTINAGSSKMEDDAVGIIHKSDEQLGTLRNGTMPGTAESNINEKNEARSQSPVLGSYKGRKSKFRSKKLLISNDLYHEGSVDHSVSFEGFNDSPQCVKGGTNNKIARQLTYIDNSISAAAKMNSNFRFTTGSGRAVEIKEEALRKAKSLLNEEVIHKESLESENMETRDNRVVPDMPLNQAVSERARSDADVRNCQPIFATQDIIEMHKLSEAFILDKSWDGTQAYGIDLLTKKQAVQIPNVSFSTQKSTVTKENLKTILNERAAARTKQEELIKSKFTRHINSIHGSLYKMKTDKSLKKHLLSSLPLRSPWCSTSSSESRITNINPINAGSFRFDAGLQVVIECADGCVVIPGIDHRVGVEEIEKAFLASTMVNPSLVPEKWIANHFKWIVWKLFSYRRIVDLEKSFTLTETLRQLKYRYDVELIEGHRSVLRKIYEQDDVPQKTMVLCVAEISVDSHQSPKSSYLPPLLLTDGWYSIGAQVDNAMMNLLHRRVIGVGHKLMIHGAELFSSPTPCHPLQASQSFQIKIHTNMIRTAKWCAKLGVHNPFGPISSTCIPCILDDGGIVGTLDVILARKYPVIYMEKCIGKTIMHSEKAHERRFREAETKKETVLQEIYSQVVKEMEEEERIQETEERNKNNSDTLVTDEQLQLNAQWKQQKSDKKYSIIQREVRNRIAKEQESLYEAIPMLKLGVLDKKGSSAVISVWRPQEEFLQLLEEGKSYRMLYLMAAEMRYGLKHLIWSKHSRIQELKDGALQNEWQPRRVTPIDCISSGDVNTPWGDLDVVGLVIRAVEMQNDTHIAYLSDWKMNVLALKFRPSMQAFGVERIIEAGSVISVCNASWKGKNEEPFASLHVSVHIDISRSPTKLYLQEAISDIRAKIQDISSFVAAVNLKIDDSISQDELCVRESHSLQLSPKLNHGLHRTEEKLLKRSTEIQRRIQTLKKLYPVTPPIHSLHMKSSSQISKPFRVPLKLIKSPATENNE